MDTPFQTSTLKNNFSQKVSTLLSAKTLGISETQKQEIIEALTPSFFTRVWHFISKGFRRRPFFYAFSFLIGAAFFVPANAAHADGAWQDFEATAYYSPVPWQKSYYMGSYEADIRLNGNGTHGADGTAVYAGMIAAPKGYDFGTYIYFEGLGLTRVHDRGGAIKVSTNGEHHDRIDIWMGYGDEWLERTKQWWRRHITGKIVESPDLYQFLNLNTINFSIGSTKSDENTTLSSVPLEQFKKIGYTPKDDDVEAMILQFQLDYAVVASSESYGAGYYGPKTKAKLAEVLAQKSAEVSSQEGENTEESLVQKHTDYQAETSEFLLETKSMGESSEGVGELQKFLKKQWYYDEEVDNTMDLGVLSALRAYQYKNNLIQTGRIDMRTRIAMEEVL